MTRTILLVLLFSVLCLNVGMSREWSNTTGVFKVEAEVFATNDNTVVLKKKNGDLIGIKIEQLSEADRAFLVSHKPDDSKAASIDQMQTWTSRTGLKVRGRVLSFVRRDVTLQRVSGKIMVNGKPFDDIDSFYQHLLPKVVAEYSDPKVKSESDFDTWMRKQGAQPQTFKLEGALLKLEDGSELAVPFFVFAEEELAILRPGWEQWQAKEATEADRKREDFLVQVQAQAYQQEREESRNAKQAQMQIQMLQLEMLAVGTGMVTIWEVMLSPRPGIMGRPTTVMVPAGNSQQAQALAMQKYPAFVAGAVRRASR